MSKAKTLATTVSTGNVLADGTVAYAEVSGTPTLATVATSGAYADVTGTPTLATVATSGSYTDLTDKPTITDTATNIAGGSNGTIPYQTAADTTAMLGVGTAGQVLQTNGAGAPTWVTPAGGGMVLLAEITASSSSYLTFNDLFTTSYDTYMFIGSDLLSSYDADLFRAECRFGGAYGSGNTVSRALTYITSSTTTVSGQNGTAMNDIYITPTSLSNKYTHFVMYAHNPKTTNAYKSFSADTASSNSASSTFLINSSGKYRYNTNSATDGIRFYYSVGPILSGVIRMYGIKKN
jgi:hypothetical protein